VLRQREGDGDLKAFRGDGDLAVTPRTDLGGGEPGERGKLGEHGDFGERRPRADGEPPTSAACADGGAHPLLFRAQGACLSDGR